MTCLTFFLSTLNLVQFGLFLQTPAGNWVRSGQQLVSPSCWYGNNIFHLRSSEHIFEQDRVKSEKLERLASFEVLLTSHISFVHNFCISVILVFETKCLLACFDEDVLLLLYMYIVFFLVAENNVILVISVMQSMLMDPNYYRDNVIYVRNA